MARSTMDFAQQNTERAVQATNWLRAMAEQNLNQSKVAFEGFLTIARDAIRNVDQQASAIREHSLALAQQTLSNTFDFANKLVRMKDLQELPHIQSEYISRQAQLLGDQTRELGQKVMEGVHEIAKATQEGVAESSRRRSEVA